MQTPTPSSSQDILPPPLSQLRELRAALLRTPSGADALASAAAEFSALEQAITERNARWLALHEGSMRLARESRDEALLQELVRSSVALLAAQGGGLTLRDEQTGELVIRVAYGNGRELPDLVGRRFKAPDGLAGQVLAADHPVMLDNYTQWQHGLPSYRELLQHAVLAVPLYVDQVAVGVLIVTRAVNAPVFTEDDAQLLTLFAQKASAALERTRAREKAAALALSEERARVARELHDGLAQDLAALLLRADLCLALAPDEPRLRELLDQICQSLQHCIHDARATIYALREPDAGTTDLVEAIRLLIAQFTPRFSFVPQISVRGRLSHALSIREEMALLSTVREALHNIEKHARAHQVQVEVDWDDGEAVRVAIQDDGCGFDPAQLHAGHFAHLHFGLQNQTERLAVLGGQLRVESAPGSGTRIEARLPLKGPGR